MRNVAEPCRQAVGVTWPDTRRHDWLAAVAGGSALAATFVAGALVDDGLGRAMSGLLLVVTLVAGTAAAGVLTRWRHRRTAQALAVVREEERRECRQDRQEERRRQYRMLHDTVLATLNAIARGGDHDPELMRRRCAAEAALLRNMITGSATVLSDLAAELGIVIRDQAAIGLRVHSQLARLPATLPPGVLGAFVGGCREAFNNVAVHSGTREAWITAATEPDGRVVVTIVDRGCGFVLSGADRALPAGSGRDGVAGGGAPGDTAAGDDVGLGLSGSLFGRMTDIGGACAVDTGPGLGTRVELRWPA